jgi:hypothetical protein
MIRPDGCVPIWRLPVASTMPCLGKPSNECTACAMIQHGKQPVLSLVPVSKSALPPFPAYAKSTAFLISTQQKPFPPLP